MENSISHFLSLISLMMCEKPSQLLGIDKHKGSISQGKFADLIIFDPDYDNEITERQIFNRYPEVCIYKGKKLRGKVKQTYLRGNLIYSGDD